MAETSASPPAHVTKTVLGAFGLVLLATLALLLHARWTGRHDALADVPPVHAPTSPDRGDGRAWEALQRAVAGLPRPSASLSDALESPGAPDAAGVAQARALEGRVRAIRHALVSTEGLVVPAPPTPDAPSPELLPFLDVARAWLLLAWDRAATPGEGPAQAVSEMLQVQALGLRLVEGDSDLVGVMVGLAIERLARRELLELLTVHGPADPTLYDAASALRAVEPGGVARALAREARWLEAMFMQEALRLSFLDALTYDEQTTRVWFRQQMQATVDRAALLRWERPAALPPPWASTNGFIDGLRNRTGRTLLDLGTPDYERSVSREDAAVAASRLAVLTIAARRYANRTGGQVPDDQAALTPGLIPVALQDPFDGQPLRLAEGEAWSVGEGATDSPDRLRVSLSPPAP